jgi:uncharacterized protein YgbK (DUF1537 family)
VRCPADHPRFSDLPVVVFPGNVGTENSLAEIYRIFRGDPEGAKADRSAA